MVDNDTLEQWIHKLGYELEREGPAAYRVLPPDGDDLPSFFVQRSENWVLMSILPVLDLSQNRPDDIYFRLLTVNRDLRIAKLALDEDDQVVLCAELPTESLDYSEFADAASRMVKYVRHYRDYLAK